MSEKKKPQLLKTELGLTNDQTKATQMIWSAICQVASLCELNMYDTMAILQTCQGMLTEGSVLALKSGCGIPDEAILVKRVDDEEEGPSEFFSE